MIRVGVASDLHLDFIVGNVSASQVKLEKVAKTLLGDSQLDCIILAGDTSHYNIQIVNFCKALNSLGIEVFITYGNHEFYNISNTQRAEYRETFSKVNELEEMLKTLSNTHLLNGTAVNFKGITIGGACGWYDGSAYPIGPYSSTPDTILSVYSNDSVKIPKYSSMYPMAKVELQKVRDVVNSCDIMVTHMCPSIHPQFIAREFIGEASNCLYTFDGDSLVETCKAKYWVYGHMHSFDEREYKGVTFIRNPLGYPGENSNFKLKVIQIEPKGDK